MEPCSHKLGRFLRNAAAAPAALLALCVAGSGQVRGADLPRDQEERGFYLALEGSRPRVSNLDFRLATNSSGGEGVRLEFDRGGEARYQIGWLLPGRKGSVGITYWEYAESASTSRLEGATVFTPTSFLLPDIDRAGVASVAEVLARAVDIGYARDFKADEKFRAAWSLGLRYFRYEHRMAALYAVLGGGPGDLAGEEVESTGVGPRVGASFQYWFTRRWSLSGSAALATLFGASDHSNVSITNVAQTDTCPSPMPPCRETTFNESRGESRTYDQIDLDLRVGFLAWRQLEVTGGYRVSHWHDARTRQGFDGSFEVERVTFDGPYLSVGYRF